MPTPLGIWGPALVDQSLHTSITSTKKWTLAVNGVSRPQHLSVYQLGTTESIPVQQRRRPSGCDIASFGSHPRPPTTTACQQQLRREGTHGKPGPRYHNQTARR